MIGDRDTHVAAFRKIGHSDDTAHDMALENAKAALRSREHDAKILTQTGAELFEKMPSIIKGAASGDVARTRRFGNDTVKIWTISK